MKSLKTEGFGTRKALARFVNENNIQKEDIVSITEGTGGFTLFYYE